MKLEENMYVRIINDIRAICIGIGKIKKIIQETIYVDMGDNLPMSFNINQIAKASHNIIDIIEEGDYINGFKVMEADWINDDLEYEEGLAIPLYSSDDLEVIENWQPLKYMKIKSIVTKEQFESMSYRVNG